MDYQKLLPIICFFFLSFIGGIAQVNFMHGENWEEAKALSAKTGKPIFIDFYTTWCGPCRLMDKNTFSDSAVSVLLNEQFVCLKLDAEKEINKVLVKLYGINAFPTAIFIDQNGDLLTKEIGYKSPEEFESLCQDLLSFINSDLYSKVTAEDIDKLTDEELERILSKYVHYNFKVNAAIKRKYYDQLRRGEQITLDAFQYLLINYKWNDEYFLLNVMIPDKISFFNEFNWNHKFFRLYEEIFRNVIEQGDMEKFEDVSTNYLKTYEKLKKSNPRPLDQDPVKEIRTKKLSFYFENKQLGEYFILADSLISEYIMPYEAETIKRGDQRSSKMLEYMDKMSENLFDTIEEMEISVRDSLYILHGNAISLANRLNEISENIVLFIDQKEKILKALEWINRSIEYIDLPESHIIKAAILKKLGSDKEIETELQIAKESPYFDKDCETKISKFNL